MSIFDQIELEEKVMKLCRSLHEKLCQEAEELDESIMTTEEVNSLEPSEALKHMTEAIKDLLSHQRNVSTFQNFRNSNSPNAVQATLQKLEADIREHIKIENQLKLYCENIESSIEETEKVNAKIENSVKKKTEELEKENILLRMDLMALENDSGSGKKGEIYLESEPTREPEAEVLAENEQKHLLLVDKCIKVKRLKEIAKSKEFLCKEMAKENKSMMDLIRSIEMEKRGHIVSNSEYFKSNYKEKCKELFKLKSRMHKKEKSIGKSHSPIAKQLRKSASPIIERSNSTLKKKTTQQPHMRPHKVL